MFNNKIMAVDIGQSEINIVVGKQKKSNVTIFDVLRMDTPRGVYNNGYILKTSDLAQSIEHIIEKNNIKANGIIFTLASTDIITRQILLPKVKKKELASMVEFEVQQYLPINIEDYILQYKILDEVLEEGTKKLKVQVAVLPRDIGNEYFKLVNQLNHKPVALDTHDNSISKLFDKDTIINDGLDIKEKTIAVINMGQADMNICIIDNGVTKFNRIVNQGAKALAINMANASELTILDAQDIIVNCNDIMDISDSFIREIINTNLSEWVENISRVFKYYTSRDDNNSVIDEIYVHGSISDNQIFNSRLSKELNLPVYQIKSLNKVSIAKEVDCDISKNLNAIGSILRR